MQYKNVLFKSSRNQTESDFVLPAVLTSASADIFMVTCLLLLAQTHYLINALNSPLFLVPSDLSKNQISDIAADAFSGLRSLTSL